MADPKARPLAPHVQAAIAAGRGAARGESVRGVTQRKEAPHVRDMSKQALEPGRVAQPKVARHEAVQQRQPAPHVQKMLGSVPAAGQIGQAKAAPAGQPWKREKAAHVREVPSRVPSPAAVQRKVREAKVVWQVTHLVEAQNESLFGKRWDANELPADIGQVTHGQTIHVDDEDVFMSRRGANQEISGRREADAAQELKNKWLGVRQVGLREFKSSDNVYIRQETIRYTTEEHREVKPVDVHVTEEPTEELFQNLQGIKKAWIDAGRKRRRSVTEVRTKEDIAENEGLTSGWNWDQYDEGVYVAGEMINPTYRGKSKGRRQWTLTASYRGEKDGPIAYLIMEERGPEDGEDEGTMYLRWLVGHPEKGGGGQAVMTQAINIFRGSTCTKLKVESAYSAVGWYKKQGFQVEEEGAYEPKLGYGDTVLSMSK